MASIRKRGSSYLVEVRKNGFYKSSTFKTKNEAAIWAADIENTLDLQSRGLQPDTLFSVVIERYIEEVTPTKRGAKNEEARLRRLLRDDIADKFIVDIETEDLERWIKGRLESVQEASVRRELATIGNIFKIALERWGYIQKNPMIGLQKPSNSKARTQRYSDEDIEAILYVSGYRVGLDTTRARVAAAMLFAIETAMRAGEICGLTWENVNFEKRIAHLPITK
ncbi:integrase [Pasteurellaceae bacterium Macca]|nr:integrase [Pasteurellaceae bacterium Macca]